MPTLRIRYDWISALLSLGMAVLFYVSSLDIAPSSYEPLGAASLPRAVAIFLLAIALIKVVVMVKSQEGVAGQPTAGLYRSLVVFGLVVLFVLAIDWFELRFGIAVFFFLMASFLYLVKLRGPKALVKAVVATAIFSILVDYVSTHILHLFL